MIFDETYRPVFERLHREGLYDPAFGVCGFELAAVATRTGKRAQSYLAAAGDRIGTVANFAGPRSD